MLLGAKYQALGTVTDGLENIGANPVNVLTSDPAAPGTYVAVAAADVRFNVHFGPSGTLVGAMGVGPLVAGDGLYRTFVERVKVAIHDSATLAAGYPSGVGTNSVRLGRFDLGKDGSQIRLSELNQGPIVYVDPVSTDWKQHSMQSSLVDADVQVRVISLARNNTEYFESIKFASNLSQELMRKTLDTDDNWLSGIPANRLTISTAKPQKLPNGGLSYPIEFKAQLVADMTY